MFNLQFWSELIFVLNCFSSPSYCSEAFEVAFIGLDILRFWQNFCTSKGASHLYHFPPKKTKVRLRVLVFDLFFSDQPSNYLLSAIQEERKGR